MREGRGEVTSTAVFINSVFFSWDAEVYTGPLSHPRSDLEELDRVVLQMEAWSHEGIVIKSEWLDTKTADDLKCIRHGM